MGAPEASNSHLCSRRAVLGGLFALPLGSYGCNRKAPFPDVYENTPRVLRVRVNELTLFAGELGDTRGRVRLVIHGGPGLDHSYLRPWLDGLSTHARLVYVDLRGHGRSSAPPDAEGFNLPAAAGDLATLLLRLSGEELPADVFGHDFGAVVALELAARYPERVRRLVLCSPVRQGLLAEDSLKRLRSALGPTGLARVQELFAPDETLRDPQQPAELFRRMGKAWWFRPPSEALLARTDQELRYERNAAAHFTTELAHWDLPRAASSVRAPTLVLQGRDDLSQAPGAAKALADRIPHGTFAELPEAGHFPFVEQNARVLQMVGSFLSGAAARPGVGCTPQPRCPVGLRSVDRGKSCGLAITTVGPKLCFGITTVLEKGRSNAMGVPRLEFAGETNVGMKRTHNEDSFSILAEENLVVVADGMGGHASGEVASKMSVDTIREFFAATSKDPDATWPYKMDKHRGYEENRLITSIKLANLRIFESAQRDPKFRGMGTTTVAVFGTRDGLLVAHVGDSRVYRVRDGQLEQLTEDHSLLNDYKKMRKLTPEEEANFPHKNVIVRALGMKEQVKVDTRLEGPKVGDIFVLCSDGLSGPVPDDEILRIVDESKSDLKAACARLIARANENGGPDNITAVAVRISALS